MAAKPQTEVEKYLQIVSSYDNEFKKWEARTTKILKRYRDDSSTTGDANAGAKFNILWSNVQTLIPAVYAKLPTADVSRRFVDNDPVGRVAALLIERTLDYEIEHYSDFRSCMRHAVEDRFLGGRGVGWVRYDPHLKTQEMPDGLEITNDAAEGPEDKTADPGTIPEEIAYECSPTDYVHWKDFGHSTARTWEEVTQVWRWVYLTADALDARFGKGTSKKVPLDSGPDQLNKYIQKTDNNRAKVCELWDLETGKVVWLSKGYPKLIDERDDPLELEGFFPCARPLYSTTTSDSLVPVPDFTLYQYQAKELDILSDRIDGLVKALRVRGVYNSAIKELQRLFTEGDNNTMIPVESWLVFAEKGGLKGSIDLVDLTMLGNALQIAYQAREDIKGQVYEITGISDIIRGESAASETATAQQIKGQYAGLRLKSMQEGVALFASELLRIKAQIICEKYQDQTILEYSAASQLSAEDQKYVPQAMQLLRKDPLQSFRIEVAADSLVQIDQQQNQQDRIAFLNTLTNFLREAVPAGQQVPEMIPMIMESIKYGVAGFKQARTIEGTIDTALEALKQKAAEMKANPPPNPDAQKIEADQNMALAKGQIDAHIAQIKAQSDAAQAEMTGKMQAASEAQKMQADQFLKLHLQQMEEKFERWKAQLQADTSIMTARISAGTDTDSPAFKAQQTSAESLTQALNDGLGQIAEHITNTSGQLAQRHDQSMQQIGDVLKQASGPKRIIRGPDGRATGVEPMPQQTIQ